ncbi:MAG: hypothetical protein HY719_08325 [Planctomycetes bacterium]|nr:hypothetical protein [Planctomycetota bacterium]
MPVSPSRFAPSPPSLGARPRASSAALVVVLATLAASGCEGYRVEAEGAAAPATVPLPDNYPDALKRLAELSKSVETAADREAAHQALDGILEITAALPALAEKAGLSAVSIGAIRQAGDDIRAAHDRIERAEKAGDTKGEQEEIRRAAQVVKQRLGDLPPSPPVRSEPGGRR